LSFIILFLSAIVFYGIAGCVTHFKVWINDQQRAKRTSVRRNNVKPENSRREPKNIQANQIPLMQNCGNLL